MLSQNGSDFIVGSNGHARLSLRKTGELLGVAHQTVARILRSGTLQLLENAETLILEGVDGGNLAILVEYYAFDSSQASEATVTQCRKIYRQAATKGFQDFLDAMAGIEPKQKQQELTFDVQVHLEIDLLQKVLKSSRLDQNLAAGVMLNHAGLRLPVLQNAVNEAHSLLAASTPSDLLLTPTAIGERLGISARQVNLLLLDIGYQIKNFKKSKDEPAYLPTETGQPYSSNTLATGRLYEQGADNTSYQHLKWKSQVVEILREQMAEAN